MRRPELPERRGRGMWWYPSWTGIDKLQEEISRVFDDFASRFMPPVFGGGAVTVDVYPKTVTYSWRNRDLTPGI